MTQKAFRRIQRQVGDCRDLDEPSTPEQKRVIEKSLSNALLQFLVECEKAGIITINREWLANQKVNERK